jgi:hypothetical protein
MRCRLLQFPSWYRLAVDRFYSQLMGFSGAMPGAPNPAARTRLGIFSRYASFHRLLSIETDSVTPLQRDQLIAAFEAEDCDKLSLPALDRIQWSNLDFLGWCDRSGDKAYFVFEDDGGATGLVLDRMAVRSSNARAFMCSICRTVHGLRGIANFTYRSRRGPGYHTWTDTFCGDLQCSLYVRGLLSPDVSQFFETISIDRKVERLLTGVERFLATIASFDANRKTRLRVVR